MPDVEFNITMHYKGQPVFNMDLQMDEKIMDGLSDIMEGIMQEVSVRQQKARLNAMFGKGGGDFVSPYPPDVAAFLAQSAFPMGPPSDTPDTDEIDHEHDNRE